MIEVTTRAKFGRWRAMLVLMSILAACAMMNAQESDRAKEVGKRLMCVCGCNQVLTECNHVGCTYSHTMLKELDDRLAQGQTDDLALQSFVQEYGPTVLLLPPSKGFNLWIWIMPILAGVFGLGLAYSLIRKWREQAAAKPAEHVSEEMLARAERESGAGRDF